MSAPRDPVFDRPTFIISPPRSGSTLLFETMARASNLYTVGGESHGVIEGLAPLNVAARGFHSNQLTADDATPEIRAAICTRFQVKLRDRAGKPPLTSPLRMLEKTPKNTLRLPFLARIFPEALFVYLHRDPRQTLSSMMEAWTSGGFRTYPKLPHWSGLPWSLLLTPGWQELVGKSLPDIVAAQWRVTTEHAIAGLEAMPAERVFGIRYDALTRDWGAEISRLCSALDLKWDQPLSGPLPMANHTVSKPDPDKWRARESEIEAVWPLLQETAERAERFIDRLCPP